MALRQGRTAFVLGWLLLSGPAWALELVKIATIPKGHTQFDEGLPVGDADHDGRRELYFGQSAFPYSGNIWEHWGSNSYQPVAINEGCHPTAVGDSDGDGSTDLLCQYGPRTFLLESKTPTTFPSQEIWEEPLGGFPGIRGYFADADQDGKQEMWIVPNSPHQVEVWENRGDNTYILTAVLADPLMTPSTLAFGDFDGDGATEIATGGTLNSLFVWEAEGDDTYTLVRTLEFSGTTEVLDTLVVASARDMDGDGKAELLVAGRTIGYGHRVVIFEANGDNSYEPVWQAWGPGVLIRTYLAVGDIDGDGVEELAVGSPDKIELFKALGDNEFGLIGQVPYPDSQAIALADLNGNGHDELIFNGGVDGDGTPVAIHIYELADIQPPVLIPAFYPSKYRPQRGEALTINAELLNRTDAVQTVDAWLELYQGDGEGGPQGSLLQQKLVASQRGLPPKKSIKRKPSLPLPVPPGVYTVQLKVGTFPDQVTDTRWFSVDVRE